MMKKKRKKPRYKRICIACNKPRVGKHAAGCFPNRHEGLPKDVLVHAVEAGDEFVESA
jgi:hypothetical protein